MGTTGGSVQLCSLLRTFSSDLLLGVRGRHGVRQSGGGEGRRHSGFPGGLDVQVEVRDHENLGHFTVFSVSRQRLKLGLE